MISRLVGDELNTGDAERLFASTPPLKAVGLLLGDLTSFDNARSRQVLIDDVSRACFEESMQMNLWLSFQIERKDIQSLYGTRDASAKIQSEVRKLMERIGFRMARYNPC